MYSTQSMQAALTPYLCECRCPSAAPNEQLPSATASAASGARVTVSSGGSRSEHSAAPHSPPAARTRSPTEAGFSLLPRLLFSIHILYLF